MDIPWVCGKCGWLLGVSMDAYINDTSNCTSMPHVGTVTGTRAHAISNTCLHQVRDI